MKKTLIVLAFLALFNLSACKKTEKIEFNLAETTISLAIGEEKVLPVVFTDQVIPIAYYTDNSNVATYIDGKVKGIGFGTTTLRVKAAEDKTNFKTCQVTVSDPLSNEYYLTYHLGDGINHPQNPQVFSFAQLPLNLKDPFCEGYVFGGWYHSLDFNTAKVTDITETGNKVLYARWLEPEEEYRINYHFKDGINNPENKESYTKSQLPLKLSAATKEGYKFVGWYNNSTFLGKPITEISTDTKGNKDFYARFEKEHKVSYHLNGATQNTNPESFSNNQLPLTLGSPVKENYKFIGWYDNPEFKGVIISAITKGGDKNLYARFETASKITYHLDGGTNPNNPTSFTDSELPLKLNKAVKKDHLFMGWFDNPQFHGNIITIIETTGDKELYAKFILIEDKTEGLPPFLDVGIYRVRKPDSQPKNYNQYKRR
ncbi:MAG: InlB B-repeat-containing protein [Erysipelotrichales bacterium]|nr:InlB B-repeat-containing protein [Erysipelotrichales bacterium]